MIVADDFSALRGLYSSKTKAPAVAKAVGLSLDARLKYIGDQ